jgi:hypothetical protein
MLMIPIFHSLPFDNFGVHVENEMDMRRLLWLVNTIGEEKLRASAKKRNKYYPDSKLFVSVILKRFHLKEPAKIYTEVTTPIYRVYVLVLRDHSCIKLGMTSAWPDRAYAFVKTADYSKNFDYDLKDLFDVNKSVAFAAGSEFNARLIEQSYKKMYLPYQSPSPYCRKLIPYGCGGHTEWFEYSIYDELVKRLSANSVGVTLEASMIWRDLLQGASAAVKH